MKKNFLVGLITGLSVFVFTGGANATLIASDSTDIDWTAQTYEKDFTVGIGAYSNVTLDLFAKGDYGIFSNEWIKFYIGGILLADWTYTTPGITVVNNKTSWDYTLSGTVSIADTLYNDLIGDQQLKVSWVNGPYVNAYNQNDNGGQDLVSWSVQGDATPVPEPATMLLFGTGLVGLAAGARRKKK